MKNKLFNECKVCKCSITKINKQHHLVKCNNCDFIFCEKIYSEEEFISVYKNLYNSLKPQYAVHSIKEFKDLQNGKINIGYHRKRIINKTVKNKSKVLEIGSGVGLIGMYLTKTKNIIYQGIEIDEETHLKAKGLGINSINGDFSLMKELTSKYDTIMLWEVFEHLQDVNLFLELVKDTLVNNGRLVFSVPNYNKRKNFNTQNNNIDNLYQSGPPIHLNFFTEKSVSNVLENHGFKLEFCKIKKFPYINFKRSKFYTEFMKSIFGLYEGPTLYVSAVYKKSV